MSGLVNLHSSVARLYRVTFLRALSGCDTWREVICSHAWMENGKVVHLTSLLVVGAGGKSLGGLAVGVILVGRQGCGADLLYVLLNCPCKMTPAKRPVEHVGSGLAFKLGQS